MNNHPEEHETSNNLRDIILGGQDGLVNVLGVVLGASAATGDAKVIIAVGLAATFAESISMAAVAYTSFKAEKEVYDSELAREKSEIVDMPEAEKEEIREIYRGRGFKGELLEKVVDQITSDEEVWLKVMMAEELGLKPVDTRSILKTAVVVGISAVIGSLIPLVPFFFLPVSDSVTWSLIVSAVTLLVVGLYKAKVTSKHYLRSSLEMMVIGIISALFGYLISRVVSGGGHNLFG